MSDKSKSLASLTALTQTCEAALASITAADGITPEDLSHISTSDFPLIRKDFIALLAYIYSETTKTALSLKPSSPTYSASLAPLRELSTRVSNLSANVRLVQQAHGLTLLKEMKSAAEKVVSSVQQLSKALLSDLASTSGKAETYLTSVGEVHQAIESIRGSGGLSTNNVDAVAKVWSADQGSLADALLELQEIPESRNDNDHVGDGWDELGIDSSPNLTPNELERLKRVEAIVKLVNLLHKTVIKRVLSGSLQTLANDEALNLALDELAKDSPALPAAVDDLVSTVYGPQDEEEMSQHLHALQDVIDDIQSHINALFALEPVAETLKASGGKGQKSPDAQKWFETCFGEIKKLINQLSESLHV